MIIKEIIESLNNWIPQKAAQEKDNVGIQVGRLNKKTKNILISLELNHDVISEAIKNKCNLIITHHPLIFYPFYSIKPENDDLSKIIEILIKNNITVFSMHTNLDSAREGVSFELAKRLGLSNIKFLDNQKANQFKLAVFVPEKFIDKVSGAIFNAEAGIIGEYKKCSFRSKGIGTFEGSAETNPTIGKKLNFEKVDEVRLEFIVDSWNLNNIISEMLKSHPYEEPAYDIYPLENYNTNFGLGTIGIYEKAKTTDEFVSFVKNKLKLKAIKYCKGKSDKIKKVAVCGGSGADLINQAIKMNADAFVSADIKYSHFRDAENQILLVDAGHYETEIFSVDIIAKEIKKIVTDKTIKIIKAKTNTNPIKIK
ncbi:MAG: Nif3-like dinuclear metal center hexameric protein [Ignavibacteriales bacterium]|nr:Nif3-like dinuclear metal center hexameric protein [Ignavibacteriales bacterium]